LDVSGNIVWQKNMGGSFDDVALSIDETDDGDLLMAGYTASSDGLYLTITGALMRGL
jgi:hypothetical protein